MPEDLNQLESEHAKGEKLYANIILELEGDKFSKPYFDVIETKFYADDKKTKYSSNPNDILISGENSYEKLYTKKKPPKLPLLTFLVKFPADR